MPASTPVYGFTYPCPGETVTPAAFALLAGQIDTKLADVDLDRVAALNRRNRDSGGGPTQTIGAGAETVLTMPSSTYTIPAGESGVWYVTVTLTPLSTPATSNMLRIRIMQNAVKRTAYTFNPEPNSPQSFSASAPILGIAGDVITTSFIYNGTGTIDVQATMSIKKFVRLA
jgi:hypothetical protein